MLCFSLDQEVYHRRRLAWTARNPLGLTVQQTSISNNSDLENLEMFNTSKSYWGDIGIVGFRTVLDNQAHIIRYHHLIFNTSVIIFMWYYFIVVTEGSFGLGF